jgi:aminoglycoside phosphotransferase (APT) family kinase protein
MIPASITALLKRWLPGRAVAISRATSGVSTEVYRIRSGNETTWLRLAEDAGENRFVEYRVHQLLRDRGVRVPEILIFEAKPPELDRSAALTSTIPGVPLSECRDPVIAATVAEDAGRDLAIINAIPVAGFGWIARTREEEPEIVALHPVRSGWSAEFLAAVKVIANAGAIDRSLIHKLNDCIVRWAGKGQETDGYLAHGDFDASHIYFDPETGQYTGIIDFGEARGTHQAYDLGHLLLHDHEKSSPAVFDACLRGWDATVPDIHSLAHLHAIAIAARQLAIFTNRPNVAYRTWLAERLTSLLENDLTG